MSFLCLFAGVGLPLGVRVRRLLEVQLLVSLRTLGALRGGCGCARLVLLLLLLQAGAGRGDGEGKVRVRVWVGLLTSVVRGSASAGTSAGATASVVAPDGRWALVRGKDRVRLKERLSFSVSVSVGAAPGAVVGLFLPV